LAERGVPYVLSNVHCAPAARALCAAVLDADDPPLLLDTPQGRVGFISAVAPAVVESIARDRAAGLTFEPPAAALLRAADAARAAGARWVVAAYDPAYFNELPDALSVLSALEAGRAPDVLLVARVSGQLSSLAGPAGSALLVATRPAGVV